MEMLQLKDFLEYRFLSGLKYAPDGQRAAFAVSNCREEDNCYESRLYLYDGQVRQMTDLGKESSFLWEDETHILFPAVRSAAEKKRQEKKEQFTSYYRLDVCGGEALPAFTLPFRAGRLEKVPGGYVAVGHVDARYPDYHRMTEQERANVAQFYADEADYAVWDEIPFYGNGVGITNKQRSGLFWIPEDGEIVRVTEPLFQMGSLCCKDGLVYYTGETFSSVSPVRGSGIYRLDPATGEAVLLAEHPNLQMGQLWVVGDRIWVAAVPGDRHGINENNWIYLLDEQNGQLTLLRQEECDMYSNVCSDCRYGGGYGWQSKDGKLYYLATREQSAGLYCLTADNVQTPILTKEGSIDCFALCEAHDEALLIAMYDNKLQELYAADLKTGALRQLTTFNEAALAGKYVADYQPVMVESHGIRVNGFVLLPKDYDPSKSYPAILDIHGGPKSAYGPVFYHEMQVWANLGYFVFFCNPKGGDGRDNEFMDIRGHYGQTDYENIMDFTDAVLEQYPQIDRSRVCVTGGSYGGFMTNWIIGHTDRFCCAASQRSISNWLSFYGVSDIGFYFVQDQCATDIYTDPAELWRQSPLCYAANVKTPTLFIHADEDYRCPLEQGQQMFTALTEKGVPSRMCVFHGENHDLSRTGKPKHRVRRLQEITNWFEKYAK